MPKVRLLPVGSNQREALINLLQLYLYDFDEFLDEGGPNERGLFDPGFDPNRYFDRPGFWAYLAWVDGRLGGFAMISDRVERRQGPGRYVDEFFVMRRYRRRGVGTAMARQMFHTFRGYWEITIVGTNLPAQAFWRVVVNAYTRGRYQEFTTHENGMDIVWLTFDSSEW